MPAVPGICDPAVTAARASKGRGLATTPHIKKCHFHLWGGISEGDDGAVNGSAGAPHWNQRMPMPAKTTE